jgi:hypothetical protein
MSDGTESRESVLLTMPFVVTGLEDGDEFSSALTGGLAVGRFGMELEPCVLDLGAEFFADRSRAAAPAANLGSMGESGRLSVGVLGVLGVGGVSGSVSPCAGVDVVIGRTGVGVDDAAVFESGA